MAARIGRVSRLRRYLGGLIALFVLVVSGCGGIAPGMEAPHVTLAGLTVVEPGVLEQRYGLRLRIQNPNPAEIQVSGLSFEIELNDQGFARGVSNRPATVPGLGEAVLEVEAVSTLESLLRQVLELQQNPERPIRYRLRGKLYGGAWSIPYPFDHSGELRLPGSPGKDRGA